MRLLLFNGKAWLYANHRLARPAHAQIRDIAAARGQNLLVGGLHMRVRAKYGRYALILIIGKRLFFGGGFGMKVNDFKSCAFALIACQNTIRHIKGVIQRL